MYILTRSLASKLNLSQRYKNMFCPIDFLELCLDFEIATFTMIFKKNPQITNKSVFSIDFNAQTLRGDKSCFISDPIYTVYIILKLVCFTHQNAT